jgi:peptidylprolyl isomerase
MTFKFSSLAMLAALTTAATAQTAPTTTPTPHKATTHHTATTATNPASTLPKIAGIPKTLFALKYIDIKIGTGELATPTVVGTSPADSKIMQYTVRYTGWFPNGTKFDSSYDHEGGKPFPFFVGIHKVIQGWDFGFQGMRIGGKRRIFVPWQLAYGESGRPGIPPKSDLVFDIELVSQDDMTSQFVRKPPTPPSSTPQPSSAPPAGQTPKSPQPQTPPQPQPAPQSQTPPNPQSL